MCRQETKVFPDLPTVGERDKGGEEEIELLLDAEAPAMRERVELERAGALVKVSGRQARIMHVSPPDERELARVVVLAKVVGVSRGSSMHENTSDATVTIARSAGVSRLMRRE
mgnify:CR=1 FL=1